MMFVIPTAVTELPMIGNEIGDTAYLPDHSMWQFTREGWVQTMAPIKDEYERALDDVLESMLSDGWMLDFEHVINKLRKDHQNAHHDPHP